MEQLSISYERFDSWKELPEKDQMLVQDAIAISQKAYSPYSKFKVGAVVVLDDGTVLKGNNQENASFSLTICAERVAFSFAKANHPDKEVVKMIVVADGSSISNDYFFSPCGACRQTMLEVEAQQKTPMELLIVNTNGLTLRLTSAKDLLPFSFLLDHE
jgi:cytidine deaminase